MSVERDPSGPERDRNDEGGRCRLLVVLRVSARDPLVRDLSVRYRRWREPDTVVVDEVSFDLEPGEAVGLVGESGSGKLAIASAVAGTLPARRTAVGGQAWLDEVDPLAPRASGHQRSRPDVGLVRQGPPQAPGARTSIGTPDDASAAPTRRTGQETSRCRGRGADRAGSGIPGPGATGMRAHLGQLSAGTRQRALVAIALARRPRLLIADEPTTSLDVTVQVEILELLREIVAETSTALIMITHDLAVAAGLCDRVNVICAGRLVESAERHRLIATPRHPYTHGLISSIPRVDPDADETIPVIRGAVGDHLPWTAACAFAPRCPRAIAACRTTTPQPEIVASRLLRCHNPVPATSA